jgi:hypothetical protein
MDSDSTPQRCYADSLTERYGFRRIGRIPAPTGQLSNRREPPRNTRKEQLLEQFSCSLATLTDSVTVGFILLLRCNTYNLTAIKFDISEIGVSRTTLRG